MKQEKKKKSNKAKTRKQSKSSAASKRSASRANNDFAELGIEPPKIYRQSQEKIIQSQNTSPRKRSSSNMTRTQKRKRDTKKRKLKNKFRKIIRWAIAAVCVLAIGAVLSLTVFFNITDITVSGSNIYDKDKILAQCIIEKGDNLFMADTDSAALRIEQNLPYIYKAEIKRKLPDTIEIKITDAAAAYSVKCEDKTYILLDNNFKTLEKGAQKASGIVIKKAKIKTATPGHKIVFKNSDVSTCLNRLASCIKENNFTEITAIYCNNISDNYVVYDNRITFKLGNSKNLESKIYKGLAACEKLNETNPEATGTMTITTDKSIYFTEK